MQSKDLLLYKSLVESDFLLVEKSLTSKLANIRKKANFKKIEFLYLLDGFSILKSVKQLINLLFFIKKNNYKLHIVTNNKHSYYLLKFILSKNIETFGKFFYVHNTFDFLIKESGLNSAVIILDNIIEHETLHLLKRFVSNNIYLIQNIDTLINNNLFGTYKIFNNFKDYKKLIFLIVLIEKIYKI